MKYYLKLYIVAILFAILTTLTYGRGVNSGSRLIYMWGYGSSVMQLSAVANFIAIYFSVIFFHIFWGNYIYKQFCTGAIYYFSRCRNIKTWYIKKCLKLYIHTFGYLLTIIVVSVFTAFISNPEFVLDSTFVTMLMVYIIIQSLFVFSTTLGINIVSIKIASSNGFIYVESLVLFLVATFFVLGNQFFSDGIITKDKMQILKMNPISYIIFCVHSSKIKGINEIVNYYDIQFDLSQSILFYFILGGIILFLGVYVVTKHDFISENIENGGI